MVWLITFGGRESGLLPSRDLSHSALSHSALSHSALSHSALWWVVTTVAMLPVKRGAKPKAGSPRTVAKRADAARRRCEQRVRKRMGEQRPAGRPIIHEDASPRKVDARVRAAQHHVRKEIVKMELQQRCAVEPPLPAMPPPSGSCSPAPASSPPAPMRKLPPATLFGDVDDKLCIVCTDVCEQFMPCGARVHRACLDRWMRAGLTGKQPTGPRREADGDDREFRTSELPWVPKKMLNTHRCPGCRGHVASHRILLDAPPLSRQQCGPR